MSPLQSRTFVIEIDRRGAQEQERLKWRWQQSHGSDDAITGTGTHNSNATVARELMRFLDEHLLLREVDFAVRGACSSGAGGGEGRGYSVEMHDPGLGGWVPLTNSTPSEAIPKNCRIHVNVLVTPPRTYNCCSPASNSRTRPPSPYGAADSTSEQERNETAVAHRTINTGSPGEALNSGGLDAGGESMLALPWRRFDRDLGRGKGGGLEVCGRTLAVQDVSNSDEGTGLFTWDGSVLLAKYIEHQLKAMTSYARRQEAPTQRRPQHNTNNNTGRPIRVLELGCGTGLAGLAAGFALGRNSGDGEDHLLSSSRPIRPTEGAITPPTKEVEVVLTDLPYVLANTRANISRNAALFEAVGVDVVATELDWCRPLPRGLIGDGCFDLILAADAVWLDDLVEPLVRTLERLTACWSSGGDSNQRQPPPSTVAADKSEEEEEVKAVANGGEFFVSASTTAISAEEKISDVLRGVSRSCAGGGNFGNDGFVSPAEGGAASAGKGGGDSDMNRGRVPAGGAFVGGSGSDKRVSVEWTSRRDRHGNVERVQKNVEHGIGDKLDTNEAGLLEAGLEQSGPVTGLATSSEIGLDASPETGPGNAQDEGWRLWWWRRRRRVLLAYQWRSERTGRALLRELDKAFYVREIAPEECHPEYLPSSSLCLFEAVRKE